MLLNHKLSFQREIERLANKVAVLQAKLIQEKNKQVKTGSTSLRRQSRLMSLGFGLGFRTTPATAVLNEQHAEDEPVS
jgi:hypothetical protein